MLSFSRAQIYRPSFGLVFAKIRARERSLPEKIGICAHVGEQTADERRQMDDVRGLDLFKYGQGLALTEKRRDARRSNFSLVQRQYLTSRLIFLFKSFRGRISFFM
jgi:hypothetical protein